MFLLVNTAAGILPEALFIPITAGKGPAPAGSATAEFNVSDCPFTVTITWSVPASGFAALGVQVAVMFDGLSGFVPIS